MNFTWIVTKEQLKLLMLVILITLANTIFGAKRQDPFFL